MSLARRLGRRNYPRYRKAFQGQVAEARSRLSGTEKAVRGWSTSFKLSRQQMTPGQRGFIPRSARSKFVTGRRRQLTQRKALAMKEIGMRKAQLSEAKPLTWRKYWSKYSSQFGKAATQQKKKAFTMKGGKVYTNGKYIGYYHPDSGFYLKGASSKSQYTPEDFQ